MHEVVSGLFSGCQFSQEELPKYRSDDKRNFLANKNHVPVAAGGHDLWLGTFSCADRKFDIDEFYAIEIEQSSLWLWHWFADTISVFLLHEAANASWYERTTYGWIATFQ